MYTSIVMVKHLLYLITPRRKPAASPIAGGDEDPEANVEDKNDDMLKKLTNVTKYKPLLWGRQGRRCTRYNQKGISNCHRGRRGSDLSTGGSCENR